MKWKKIISQFHPFVHVLIIHVSHFIWQTYVKIIIFECFYIENQSRLSLEIIFNFMMTWGRL